MSPDPLPGWVADPESLNRYSYVRNDPCNRTDPLGLAHCDFKVKLVNDAGLSKKQVTWLEQRINEIFGGVSTLWGDTVGVTFTFSGEANATLTVTNAGWLTNLWGTPMGGEGGMLGGPSVYMNNLPSGFSDSFTGLMAGSVGAHELAHEFLGSGELPYYADSPNILSFDNAPGAEQAGALVNPASPLWNLSPWQVAMLFYHCSGRVSGSGEVAGGGGNDVVIPIIRSGFGFWFDDLGGGGDDPCPNGDCGPGSGWNPGPLPPLGPRPH